MSIVQTVGLFDTRTGDVLADQVVFIGKNPRFYDRGYIKVFTAFLDDVVESNKLAGKSIRLLFYMLQHLDYDSLEVVVIPRYAQEALNITDRTYRRWVRDLVEADIVEKVDKYKFRLKPYTFVKGSHEKATKLEKLERPTQSQVKEV